MLVFKRPLASLRKLKLWGLNKDPLQERQFSIRVHVFVSVCLVRIAEAQTFSPCLKSVAYLQIYPCTMRSWLMDYKTHKTVQKCISSENQILLWKCYNVGTFLIKNYIIKYIKPGAFLILEIKKEMPQYAYRIILLHNKTWCYYI